MAIDPPSDLVMDVLRAGDPAAVAEARQRLASRTAATAPVEPFAPVLAATPVLAAAPKPAPDAAAPMSAPGARGAPDPAAETYRRFEAMVLQNFIEAMLPDDSTAVFGEGTSGDIWKSMMAEQMASVVAERGGIGIADRLVAGRADRDAAASLVHSLQRDILREIGASEDAGPPTGETSQ